MKKFKKKKLKKIRLANINITRKKENGSMIKRKKEKKRLRKKFPKILHRTSTYILVTPDPIPDQNTHLPNHRHGSGLTGQQESDFACLQRGLTADGTGAYDILSYHQER